MICRRPVFRSIYRSTTFDSRFLLSAMPTRCDATVSRNNCVTNFQFTTRPPLVAKRYFYQTPIIRNSNDNTNLNRQSTKKRLDQTIETLDDDADKDKIETESAEELEKKVNRKVFNTHNEKKMLYGPPAQPRRFEKYPSVYAAVTDFIWSGTTTFLGLGAMFYLHTLVQSPIFNYPIVIFETNY
jgi:hypothetical protein